MVRLAFTLLLGALLFRKFVSPGINEALGDVQEAVMKITNVAKLAGVKAQEYTGAKNIEKSVARDIINEKIPELEALKVFLSPGTWEEIEGTIENNPEAILQLWDKYGHLIGGLEGQQKPKLDF